MGKQPLGAATRINVVFSMWASGPAVALAGAWPQELGKTEIFATVAAERYNTIQEPEFDIYAEHGVSKTRTAIAGVRWVESLV